jgi:hypothetical protein
MVPSIFATFTTDDRNWGKNFRRLKIPASDQLKNSGTRVSHYSNAPSREVLLVLRSDSPSHHYNNNLPPDSWVLLDVAF